MRSWHGHDVVQPSNLKGLKGFAMTDETGREVLDVLACKIDHRPANAPSIFDVVDAVQSVRREADSLIIEFDPTARDRFAAFVAAEERCCAEIGWFLEPAPAGRLRVSGTSAQLDIFAQLFGR